MSVNLLLEILKPRTRLQKLLVTLIMALTVLVALVSLLFNEIKKQDISKSQLEIEKNRVTQIDKQLSNFYSKTYSSSDTTSIMKGQNKEYFLKQIEFLKKQREDAVKNIDTINQSPDTQILIFTLLASVLTIFVLTFFTSSFKSNPSLSQKEKILRNAIAHRSATAKNNGAFLNWVTTNEIAKTNSSELDLAKAKSLKEIYDMSEALGDDRDKFLSLIIGFTNLKRKQEEIKSDKHSQIYSVFENVQERLRDECSRLNKQALINLFLCFFITFILMSYITYTSIVPDTFKYSSGSDILIRKFVPRIIAVTSFLTMFLYFVKLYKTNIVDVKYYQNELTNIEVKQTSLRAALTTDDSLLIKDVILNLNTTERNAILTKDQTSIEIERIKIENDLNKEYLTKVWELLSIGKNEGNKNGS